MAEEKSTPRAASDNDEISLKASWVGFEETTVVSANQFVSQFMEDGLFILSFGMVTPPFLLGSAEEQKQQALEMGFVPVETLSRLAITPARIRELIQVLEQNLAKFEQRSERKPSE
ncbi:MAG: hypothetical protein WD960_03660 [Gemmatimonadota bacterium]